MKDRDRQLIFEAYLCEDRKTIEILESRFEDLLREFNKVFNASARGPEEQAQYLGRADLVIFNKFEEPYFSLYSKDPLRQWAHGPVGHWKPTNSIAGRTTEFRREGLSIGYQGEITAMIAWWETKSDIDDER